MIDANKNIIMFKKEKKNKYFKPNEVNCYCTKAWMTSIESAQHTYEKKKYL